MTTARNIVDEVLGRSMTREIWTGNYDKAIPVSLAGFDLTAVLPAVFYMFRFGQRRGGGKFLDTFGSAAGTPRQRRQSVTIEQIAATLAKNENFTAFDGDVEQTILGDLLLCFCLENVRHAVGRTEQVQRVAPTHYMASWVDLPISVGHLRQMPETIVSILADQQGEYVRHSGDEDRTWFAVGKGHENNVLLRAFRQGVERRGELDSLTSDRFNETDESIGLDQLLMIRLAQQLGEAPHKLRGKEGDQISNQRPIAERAAKEFSEDIRRFVRSYADIVPRHAFVELLESCIAVGMTTILTSSVEILFGWADTGEVRKSEEQEPACLFVDCSNGMDRRLRTLSENSLDDFMRRIERLPVILMALRLLDRGARYDRNIRKLTIQTRPYATAWLNLLGELLHERRPEARDILNELDRKTAELAEKLEDDYQEAAQTLRNEDGEPNPVRRLAEALTFLIGSGAVRRTLIGMVDSTWLIGRPNGLAAKRKTRHNDATSGKSRQRDVRSLIFTDPVLDYLAHLHVLRSGSGAGARALSFRQFIHKLRERHGFYVDTAPPGMTISNALLQANRAVLERRLRDLGLLVGVNDAEAMKRLQPRFDPTDPPVGG